MVLQVIRVFRDVEICEKDLALYLRYFPPHQEYYIICTVYIYIVYFT